MLFRNLFRTFFRWAPYSLISVFHFPTNIYFSIPALARSSVVLWNETFFFAIASNIWIALAWPRRSVALSSDQFRNATERRTNCAKTNQRMGATSCWKNGASTSAPTSTTWTRRRTRAPDVWIASVRSTVNRRSQILSSPRWARPVSYSRALGYWVRFSSKSPRPARTRPSRTRLRSTSAPSRRSTASWK